MTPKQREAWELYVSGMSTREVAKALGIAKTSAHERIQAARIYNESSEGVQAAVGTVGIDISTLHSGWLKTEDASLYFKMPSVPSAETTTNIVREAFFDIPKAPEIQGPEAVEEDMLTVYPIFDAHIGMKSWGKETGEDYDLKIVESRIINGMSRCIGAAPKSAEAVILIGGDLLHANDNSNMTPASKHVLDVDSRHMQTIDVAIRCIATSIEMAASHHDHVIVAVIPGNHDRDAYLAVLFALGERYRESSRITVQRKPGDFFVYQFGRVMIAAHHGDKAKAERLVMHMADEWPKMWGETRYRYYFTGHLHHAKMQDIGGVQVEQLRAVAARDAYAASHAYASRSDMQSITYHRDRGEISRVKVSLD